MRRSGFTLIELLIVIGIVAVLVAVLTPTLHKSRLQAKATVCNSNVRQLSIALFTYATDNGVFPYGLYNDPDIPPPEGGYAGYQQYDRMTWWWFNYLEGLYIKNMGKRTLLQCPSKQLRQLRLENDILCGNYGVNLSICKMPKLWGNATQEEFLGEPRTDIEIIHPSRTLLLLDSGYAIISWWHAADIPPIPLGNSIIEDTSYVPGLKINKDRLFWPGGDQHYDALYGRHPNKTVNVGFMDGHVARISADNLLVEKSSEGYKNVAPLWCPK
jgi:prepilin-type N-terminal cleavage/methylation domain-containing protein/prepilin-type processing-associated H-X9-DG protein